MLFRKRNTLIYKASKPTNLQMTEQLVNSWSWDLSQQWGCGSAAFPQCNGSQGWQDCQDGTDSWSFPAGSFPALLCCAEKSVEKSTLGAGGLSWRELPRRTGFIVECLVAASLWEKNFHKHHKTGWPSKLTQAGHRISVSWNYTIKDFCCCSFPWEERTCVLANKYWILVSHWILMTGWLEPVLQLWGESRKEEGLLERVRVSMNPGHAAAGLVLASYRQEEKKPSF